MTASRSATSAGVGTGACRIAETAPEGTTPSAHQARSANSSTFFQVAKRRLADHSSAISGSV